ncbi:MAG: RNA 2',3'-cyclic phosphodiesterase [Patescibacteria group bacterium]|jgi:2'-5' RNA ligase
MNQRLFIAIHLDAATKLAIAKIAAKLPDSSALNKTRVDNLHLTLQFLGDTEEDLIPEIQIILNNVANRHPSAELKFTQLSAFPSWQQPHHLRLGVVNDSLKNIQADLLNSLIKIVPTLDARPFQPHITLARVKSLDVVTLNKLQSLNGVITLPAIMSATSIDLMASTLTPHGPIYTLISQHHLVPVDKKI